MAADNPILAAFFDKSDDLIDIRRETNVASHYLLRPTRIPCVNMGKRVGRFLLLAHVDEV